MAAAQARVGEGLCLREERFVRRNGMGKTAGVHGGALRTATGNTGPRPLS